MHRFSLYAVAAASLFGLVACAADSGDGREPAITSTATPDRSSPEVPASARLVTNLLDWQPTVADVANTDASLTITGPHLAVLERGSNRVRLRFPKAYRVTDALLDDNYAVVINQDPQENEPGLANVVELATDSDFVIGPESPIPTTNGGTWALGEGKAFHATYGPKNAYCLAQVDLATQQSAIAWCAPKNQGFNDARITPAGLTVMSFVLGKDGCRTPMILLAGDASPLLGPSECLGWDSLVTPQGTLWSEVVDPNRVEEASFFAAGPDGAKQELGKGDTGSLTWCGSAAYFTQQPQADGDPARLLRWTRTRELEVVYETPGAPGFISEPRCGGSRITIDTKSEGGDEHVSAPVD